MHSDFYHAARNTAAVVKQEWLGAIALSGAERASWLQGMVTNDVEKLGVGDSCYAAHLNAQGRLIAQMTVLAEKDRILLTMEKSVVSKLLAAFDKLIIMEDVQTADISESHDVLGVFGPNARAVLTESHVVAGVLGYDVLVPREMSSEVFKAIVHRGATAIDYETWNVLRTEAGLPIYGVDIDETTTMPELGDRGISYDKGCYIGQEVVAKIKYIGHVNRRFVGFTAETGEVPEARSVIRRSGKDVGVVTTSLFSPGLGKPIALGFANRAAAEAGTRVELVGATKVVPAVVTKLPFVV